jgi:predicted butyrate kinase (DUF1464 family)
MERPIIAIHDENENATFREMNDEEFEQFLIDQQIAKAKEAAQKAAIKAKAVAEAKLAELGLTTEDLKALGL